MGDKAKIRSNEQHSRTVAYEAVGELARHSTFDLRPGLNEVDAEAWDKAKAIATIAHLIETGILVEE